jgi:hypothetical protein
VVAAEAATNVVRSSAEASFLFLNMVALLFLRSVTIITLRTRRGIGFSNAVRLTFQKIAERPGLFRAQAIAELKICSQTHDVSRAMINLFLSRLASGGAARPFGLTPFSKANHDGCRLR